MERLRECLVEVTGADGLRAAADERPVAWLCQWGGLHRDHCHHPGDTPLYAGDRARVILLERLLAWLARYTEELEAVTGAVRPWTPAQRDDLGRQVRAVLGGRAQ